MLIFDFIYLASFFLSLFESILVLGVLVPGSLLIITFIYYLDTFSELLLLCFCIGLGSFLGSIISFYIGKNIKLNYPRAKSFALIYGNVSIFLAKFFGPLKSLIPFVFASLKFNQTKFIILDFTASFIWSISYVLFFKILKDIWFTSKCVALLIFSTIVMTYLIISRIFNNKIKG
jgi:membrane protein DedA with SNARE-associated domain